MHLPSTSIPSCLSTLLHFAGVHILPSHFAGVCILASLSLSPSGHHMPPSALRAIWLLPSERAGILLVWADAATAARDGFAARGYGCSSHGHRAAGRFVPWRLHALYLYRLADQNG